MTFSDSLSGATAQADALLQLGRRVIEIESQAIAALRIDRNFVSACRLILDCRGRTVVIGMGKSGHIAGKIAATLASTGTPAFFVHPGEAAHGDLGMIVAQDLVLALSHSGETEELTLLIPMLKRRGIPLIAITGASQSTLAEQADVSLDVRVSQEACPLGLAPTASTTAALAMGDALAISLLQARGFGPEDFARTHPSGSLGRRLLLHVSDVMHTGADIPRVSPDSPLTQALVEMTSKRLGTTAVTNQAGQIVGIFTDGDLRRTLDARRDLHRLKVSEVMTRECKTIAPGALAAEAARLMEQTRINALLVADEQNFLLGILNMHDLLRAQIL